ncbi:acylphosphatase, partial [Escherichia coli]|nr:acylphosphatase [Escherichia coli]EFC4500831.1 acylphosphatase [Escherichia coli]
MANTKRTLIIYFSVDAKKWASLS